jgi:nucleoside-diphosphate-sugar epimerase
MRSLSGKKVLITGSAGFVGANLARMALQGGAEVHIITRRTSDRWRIRRLERDLTDHIGDLSDFERTREIVRAVRPEIIYHAAAYGGSPSQKVFEEIIRSNFTATANLVNACKSTGFELFVNTGTSSEYGPKEVPMREDDLLKPINDYGVSKSAATLYCQAAALRDDLPIATLRLFSPYGDYEGASRLVPSAILACLRGEAPRISSHKFVRDFIYIDDVMDAYTCLGSAKRICGEIFNVACGEEHSVGEVVQKIIEIAEAGSLPETGVPQAWPNEPSRWQAEISKARTVLKWEPKHSLKSGLEASVEWFRDNLDLYQGQKI